MIQNAFNNKYKRKPLLLRVNEIITEIIANIL